MTDTQPRFAWDWVGWWTIVFVANLPISLLCSWGAVQQGCGFGLYGAVAMLYLMGAIVCGLRWRVGRSLCWGGAAVACTQCLPLLQMFTGYFAVCLWDEMAGTSTFTRGFSPNDLGEWELVRANFEVCAIVFMTAVPLMLLSVVVGVWIRVIRRDGPLWRNPPHDPDEQQRTERGPPNPFVADDENTDPTAPAE